MYTRIIPRLDIKGPNLVKGIHFEGLRVLGKPERFARYYYENGADELFYQDAVASLYGRNSLHEIVKKTLSYDLPFLKDSHFRPTTHVITLDLLCMPFAAKCKEAICLTKHFICMHVCDWIEICIPH